MHANNIAKNRNINPFASLTASNDTFEDHAKSVKITEIKLAVFYAIHNIVLEIIDDMVPMLKDTFIDSQIAKDLTLLRKKCS